jgi:ligand-binding sensor domain-containing protein
MVPKNETKQGDDHYSKWLTVALSWAYRHLARWICLGSCLWFLGILPVWSQTNRLTPDAEDFLTRNWQVEDGLPQNSVICMAQTHDGYLWLGTFSGLVRFDGVHFTVFDATDTPGLASSRIVRLFCDRQGQLWLVDEIGGITVRRGVDFERVGLEDSLLNDRVNAIGEDALGRICVGTASGAVFRWEDKRFVTVLSPRSGTERIPPIFQIEPDAGEGMWIVCDQGRAYHVQDSQATPMLDPEGRNNEIRRLARARSGGVWALTTHSGVLRWHGGQWSKGRWSLPSQDRFVWHMMEDARGGLWLSQYQERLWYLAGEGSVEPITLEKYPLFARVRLVFEDHEGNLWAGTDGEGLVQFRPCEIHMLGQRHGLSHEDAMCVMEDGVGGTWFSYNGGGIDRITASGEIEMLIQEPVINATSPIWQMLKDSSGTMWISKYSEGLIRYSEGKFAAVAGMPSTRILSVFEDRQGAIWVGGRNERGELPGGLVGGVARIQKGDITTYRWVGQEHDGVRAIAEDKDGTVWLGTDGAGLFRVENDQVVPFVPLRGLAAPRISALATDAEGNLWMGTFRNGLLLLREGRIYRFQSSLGLSARNVFSLAWEGSDHLWMATEQGLIRVSRHQLIQFATGQARSIMQLKLNRTSGLQTFGEVGKPFFGRNGRAWVPTVKGVGWFRPDELQINTNPPPVHVEAITVNGVRHDLNRVTTSNTVGAVDEQRVIPAGNRTLEFHYTALSYSEPEAVRFRYRLEGLEDEWNWAEDRRSALYNMLSPGQYRFHVMAANNHGVWNESGASLEVRVEPYFWQTRWFFGSVLLGLIGLSSGGAAFVLTLKHRRDLERTEDRNTRLRAEALAATNRQLEVKTVELEDALSKVKTLRGLIPICASCKKIRDDQGFWSRVEIYIQEHSEATFSHGICPDCARDLYPDLYDELEAKRRAAKDKPVEE